MPTSHDPPAPFAPDLHDARHLWLKAVLLLIWALVSFGACWFASELQFTVAGWPLGYWMASQGAVLIFIVLIIVYCLAMNYFERQEAFLENAAPHDGDRLNPDRSDSNAITFDGVGSP